MGIATGSLVGGVGLAIILTRPAVAAPPAQVWATPEVVIAIPEHDLGYGSLMWGACVLRQFAEGIGSVLSAELATPESVREAILEVNPKRFYAYGHGEEEGFTLEEVEWFFDSAGLNLDLVSGHHIHLLSCLTAVNLGHKIIDAGAASFFGYSQEFLSWHCDRTAPCGSRFNEASFYGDIRIEEEFQKGETSLEAIFCSAILQFDQEITYWEEHFDEEACNGMAIDEFAAQALISGLIHNRDALRCYFPGGQFPAEVVIEA